MSSGEERAFFGKGCCENARMPSGKEKEDWRDFSKEAEAGMALTAIGEFTQ